MRFVDEFRNPAACEHLLAQIHDGMADMSPAQPFPLTFMEVCGTHTMAISRFGLRSRLPPGLLLVSGPGCPVCVTPTSFLDRAVAVSRLPGVIVATFGDLIRVPGSETSLERERSAGADLRVVYSCMEALDMARREPTKSVVFLGVGFETTAPTTAALLLRAEQEGLANVFLLSNHKVMPPVMRALLDSGEVRIRGFLCPGHVSVVTGSNAFVPLAREYDVSCVISGFEPVDILSSLLMLVRQVTEGRTEVESTYARAVTPAGNPTAQRILERAFQPADSEWRGIGVIPGSGLRLRDELSHRDAEIAFPVDLPSSHDNPLCRCAEVLRGIALPGDCPLFGLTCSPIDPQGACMVSSEGTCAAYYRYERAPGRRG